MAPRDPVARGEPGSDHHVAAGDQLEHAGKRLEGSDAVRVAVEPERSVSREHPAPDRVALPAVAIVREQPHAMAVDERRQPLHGRVGAGVVDHDQLVVAVVARVEPVARRLDGPGYPVLLVERGDHHRYPGLAHARILG